MTIEGNETPMALPPEVQVPPLREAAQPAPRTEGWAPSRGESPGVTLELGGRARYGHDVEWVDSIDYTVDPRRAERFYAAIRRYWPGLPDGALEPGYAGIRPKIAGKGAPAADFVVQGSRDHGVPGLVHLCDIESPGLTASLALADHVAALLNDPIQGKE